MMTFLDIHIAVLVPYIAPAVVVLGGARWCVGILWGRFEKALSDNAKEARIIATALKGDVDVRHEANMRELTEIKREVTGISGTVTSHTAQLATLEGQVGVMTQVMSTVLAPKETK